MLEIDIRKKPVFWINLDEATERRDAMLKFFDEHDFEDVTRIPGVVVYPKESKTSAVLGCSIAALDAFHQAPAEDFIMLEDDCVASEWFSPILRMPDDTDAFYMGVSQGSAMRVEDQKDSIVTIVNLGRSVRTKPITYELRRVANMLSAHAIYYRTARYADMCRALRTDAIRLEVNGDILFALQMAEGNVYCNRRPIFYQHSNIEATKIELA